MLAMLYQTWKSNLNFKTSFFVNLLKKKLCWMDVVWCGCGLSRWRRLAFFLFEKPTEKKYESLGAKTVHLRLL